MAIAAGNVYARGQKRSRSEFQLVTCIVICAFHLAAIAGLMFHVVGLTLPSLPVISTTIVMYSLTTIGITASFHRGVTHEGYHPRTWVKVVLVCLGSLAFQGDAILWSRDHLAHHANTDKPGDPHSPFQYEGKKGLLWAHTGWLFYAHNSPAGPARIENDKFLQWTHRYYWIFVVATLGIPALVGGLTGGFSGAIDGLFIAGFLRIVIQLNVTWSVNSICHLYGRRVAVVLIKQNRVVDPDTGQVTFENRMKQVVDPVSGATTFELVVVRVVVSDGSRNNIWLAIPTAGESYHALHHLFSNVAYHGWGRWDLDPTKWLIITLERLDLVSDVRKPPPHILVATSPPDEFRETPNSFLNREELEAAA